MGKISAVCEFYEKVSLDNIDPPGAGLIAQGASELPAETGFYCFAIAVPPIHAADVL